jgi:hypothetical protein
MRLITIICTTTFLLFAVVAAPAKAEVLVNEWQEFAFGVDDDFGCAGEDGVASGVVHVVVTDFRKGNLGIHFNAIGIWKGNDSGVELSWKENITDIIPIGDFGNHFVGTISQSVKIIGPGGLLFRLNAKVHLTEVGGDFIVFFSDVTTVCRT